MSQSDISLADQTGYNYVQSVNAALQAVATDFSGNSEPSETFPYMKWRDTSVSPSVVKIRNATNTAWVISQVATSSGTLTPTAAWNDVPSLSPEVFNEQAQALLNRTETLNPDNLPDSSLDGSETFVTKRDSSWFKSSVAGVLSLIRSQSATWTSVQIFNAGVKRGAGGVVCSEKQLSGTMPASGATVTILHGVALQKLRSVSISVETADGRRVFGVTGSPLYEFAVAADESNLILQTGTSATNVANRPFIATLTFEV